ncbi:Clavaminate synthase-like protein [Setomelanomma holmii]|uniref:Clavaminate synthase-like protein n=1 Tax=Setomelanomma holmii TaxID=210430 RepID=A0A9P4H6Z1_9PLEO|nr:Clavaminate synthase-like protein [Setomelanomma holmii]
MLTTRYIDRPVPTISLHDFDTRVDTVTADLVDAAENHGFFTIIDHGISRESHNAGWEKNAQVRPSTGLPDRFREEALEFMHKVQSVSEKLMRYFAHGLGFEDEYLVRAHDVARPQSQTVCRLLYYFETPRAPSVNGEVYHRAGAHADWDFLTLLFQKAGQSGLEICPGREVSTEFGYGDAWTKVEPDAERNAIVCNVGDLLMSWSDDSFKSTFHRVKAPSEAGDFWGERYSIAYFNQPCKDARIQGKEKKYEMVTGEEFTKRAMERNYKAIQEKLVKA